MSIAEKLTTIAENEQRVYESGKKSVINYDNYALLFDFRNYEGELIEIESNSTLTYCVDATRTTTQSQGFCCNNKNLKRCIALLHNAISARFAFCDCHNLEYIEVDMSKIVDNDIYSAFNSTFAWCYALKRIEGQISLLNCMDENTFTGCKALEYVAFVPQSINLSISLRDSANLNADGVQTLINGLADLTGLAAQILDLHSDVVVKLTDEQILQITNKNWTVI